MKTKTKAELLEENEALKEYVKYLKATIETAHSIIDYTQKTKLIKKKSESLQFFIWCILSFFLGQLIFYIIN